MATSKETEPLLRKFDDKNLNSQQFMYETISPINPNTESQLFLNISEKFDDSVIDENLVKQYKSADKIAITYMWKNINVYCTAKNKRFYDFSRNNKTNDVKKQLLKNVSGIAYPGELLVIMGSSGAGKTTLLNVLTFRCSSDIMVTGNIAINGKQINPNILASQMAYVQQDDLFIGTLTVKEHLLFQALVRMDTNIPYQQRLRRVNEVISELALTKCRNTIIGIPGKIKGISGGEMKRLSFASEVLTDPPLMLCDEPTSGLDSYMAHQVISVLKNLSSRGKTIITTLHQPSSELFSMFSKILLIAEGRVAFMGSTEEADTFFKSLGASCPSNYNPADFYIQLLAVVPGREYACRHAVNKVCDQFESSNLGKRICNKVQNIIDFVEENHHKDKNMQNKNSTYKASWLEQFKAVLWRSWLSVIKEPILIKVRMLQTIMVSLLIGIIYLNQKVDQDGVMNINGALFIFLTNMTFQNVFAVIHVFCSELPIFLREHANGMYRTEIYFLCKTMAEAPIFIAVPFLFTIIAYPMIGLYPDMKHFFTTVGIVALVANVATSFGYLISCISTHLSMALSIGPPVIIPFLLFGGFFLNTASVPVYLKWFSYLSWFRYGNEALLINQWADIKSINCTRSNATCPKSGLMVLQTLNFNKDFFWMDICALIILMIVFRIVSLLALISKTLKKKN